MLRQVFLLLAALFVVLDVNAASLRKGTGSEASIHAGGAEQASITTSGDMFLRGSYKTQNENWALNYCDELGANCSTAAELANAVAGQVSPTGQIHAGFPDAIKCDSGGNASVLYMTFDYADGSALYRLNENPTNGADKTLYYNADGSYNNHSNLTGYNCVTSTWSISDLYANDRAFNFTGENVSVGGGAVVSITDIGNVDALTPTDGQVLTWNNTNSKWEATDVAASVSATGQMLTNFPDAIKCVTSGGSDVILYLVAQNSSNLVSYRYINNPESTSDGKVNYTGSGTYSSSSSSASTYDCVTSTWSISDLYANDRAFNFTGENVSVGGGAVVSITDIGNVDALTPTDGQVLTWNNTNSKWEASDVASSVSATGQILSGFPDAVKCVNGSVERILHLYIKTATEARYQKIAYPTDSSTEQLDLNLDGSYKAHSGLAGYDCISKSVSTLYSEDKAFNFTGENVSVGGGLWVDETSYISRTSDVHIVGNLVVTGDVSATEFNVTSDRTKKKNIETLGSALDKISDLRGVNFEWKEGDKPSGQQVGLIAQEVKEVFPEIVKGEEGGMAVNYSALVAPLIEAVKELKAQNEELRSENAEFRQRLDKLEE